MWTTMSEKPNVAATTDQDDDDQLVEETSYLSSLTQEDWNVRQDAAPGIASKDNAVATKLHRLDLLVLAASDEGAGSCHKDKQIGERLVCASRGLL
jgi:hypothetical protein